MEPIHLKLNAESKAFLSQRPVKMHMDGAWVAGSGAKTFATCDPGSAEVIAEVAAADAADVDRAVKAAANAFHGSGWATMPADERAAAIYRLADAVREHGVTLSQIEALDTGKTCAEAYDIDVIQTIDTLRYFAEISRDIPYDEPLRSRGAGLESRRRLQPYGVCAFIFPWNFPLGLLAWGIAPALAAGNAVVKPAEDTPLSSLYFCTLLKKAGVPRGVVNVISGDGPTTGAALAAHPGIARMSFTGSSEVGVMVNVACARNLVPAKLELGGKGAAVVFEDVEIPPVAQALCDAITVHAGQICCTATRWLIQERIWDSFVAEAKAILESLPIGHGFNPATKLGPVVSETQRQRILGYLEQGSRQGAKAILPGGKAEVAGYPNGFYVKPALLTGSTDNICCREEIFGPVAYLLPFRDEEEAVRIVNDTSYGLANSVWTKDLTRANRVAEGMNAGSSWINGHNLATLGVPYGGWRQSGCGGGVCSRETLMDYLRVKAVTRRI